MRLLSTHCIAPNATSARYIRIQIWRLCTEKIILPKYLKNLARYRVKNNFIGLSK